MLTLYEPLFTDQKFTFLFRSLEKWEQEKEQKFFKERRELPDSGTVDPEKRTIRKKAFTLKRKLVKPDESE